MLRRHIGAAFLGLAISLAAPVSGAFAANHLTHMSQGTGNGSGGGTGSGGDTGSGSTTGNGGGNGTGNGGGDGCGHLGCSVPESPVPAGLPVVALAVFGAYVGIQRRRSAPAQPERL